MRAVRVCFHVKGDVVEALFVEMRHDAFGAPSTDILVNTPSCDGENICEGRIGHNHCGQDGSISEFEIYHPLAVVCVYPVVADILVVQLSDPNACL